MSDRTWRSGLRAEPARRILERGTMRFAELDRRLQYGPGMRAQRIVEAALLVAAFFTTDLRFAWAALVLMALQTLSPRLVPVALVASLFVEPPAEHRLGDLYFDLSGTRGACALSALVMWGGIELVQGGHDVIGFALLTMPTASLVLAPTVGFCSGCAVYVGLRDVLARSGLATRYPHGVRDVDLRGSKATDSQ